MENPIMKKVKGDGLEIQLAEWQGQGKTVLCVHGLTANCRCWDVLADALAPKHRVLAMDLRGRGLSDKPSSGYSLEQHCRDIVEILENLGLEKVVLMGHSLGAFISTVFAAEYPEFVDRVVLVDGGGKLSEAQMLQVFEGIKPSLDRLGQVFPSFNHYLDLMKQAPFLQPWTPSLETYYEYEIEEVAGGVRSKVHPEHMEEERMNLGKVDVSEFYGKITCPVLILRADRGMLSQDDILLPEDVVERMTKEISNAKRYDVEGSNHYTIMFHPNDGRDAAVLDFLAESRNSFLNRI